MIKEFGLSKGRMILSIAGAALLAWFLSSWDSRLNGSPNARQTEATRWSGRFLHSERQWSVRRATGKPSCAGEHFWCHVSKRVFR